MIASVLALVLTQPANDNVARARVLFQSGRTHYELGSYSEAIRDFAAGYALSPRPEFLLNLGQAYRASGDATKAIELFNKYLERAPPDAPLRSEVRSLIAELTSKLEAQRVSLPADVPRKSEPLSMPSSTPEAAPPPESPKPVSVGWILAGAGLVVAAVATVVAIGAASGQVSCAPGYSLGCIDLRGR
jgi:tetratricopeptide (TPR) repeat protein